MEKETENAVLSAISGFNAALKTLQGIIWFLLLPVLHAWKLNFLFTPEYRDEISDLIEKSVKNEDYNIWFRIREKTEQKDRFLELAESQGDDAMYVFSDEIEK